MTRALGWLAALGLLAGLAAGFGYAPREAVQGNVQRIMYLHVPSVLTAYLAFGLVLLGSIAFLATRRPGWDRLAGSAGEIISRPPTTTTSSCQALIAALVSMG